ncbi:hypothetical protein KUTeg_012190 [Tegillarca granosa]|uniref:Secreted protein n=1 Tax=Tegillarca granosa TaxID=220873 RepID=A0ABQ9EYU3_TEGGR|nr:hypothetical protein KUTeg_012190 [Tegillarca granosa]
MFRRCNILIIFEITQIVFGNQELCSNDPCTADNLLTLSDVEERSPMCSDGGGNKCDGWYHVNIPMSNKCSGLNWIGTVFSVWLNGSGPSETDGAVERNVCIVGPDREGEKCNEENTTTETIETTVVTTINKDSESATEYASNLENENQVQKKTIKIIPAQIQMVQK